LPAFCGCRSAFRCVEYHAERRRSLSREGAGLIVVGPPAAAMVFSTVVLYTLPTVAWGSGFTAVTTMAVLERSRGEIVSAESTVRAYGSGYYERMAGKRSAYAVVPFDSPEKVNPAEIRGHGTDIRTGSRS